MCVYIYTYVCICIIPIHLHICLHVCTPVYTSMITCSSTQRMLRAPAVHSLNMSHIGYSYHDGVMTIGRLPIIVGLFCKRGLLKYSYCVEMT